MKEKSNINERILYLIEFKANNNKKKFAEMIGYAPQVISNIVSGRKTKPSFEVIHSIISSFVDINPDWLLTGKGEMLRTEGSAGPPSADQVEILELLRWKVERLEEENKKLKEQIGSLKSELDQSPPGIRKSELKK